MSILGKLILLMLMALIAVPSSNVLAAKKDSNDNVATEVASCASLDYGLTWGDDDGDGEDDSIYAVVSVTMNTHSFGKLQKVDYVISYVTIPYGSHEKNPVKRDIKSYTYKSRQRLIDADPGKTYVSITGYAKTTDGTICNFDQLNRSINW